MFSKSFNLSGILSRSRDQGRTSSVLQPKETQNDERQQEIKRLKEQNTELKQQLQKLKELFIETRISHDNEIRAYDQLLQQTRNELNEKEKLIGKYYLSLKRQDRIGCDQIQQDDGQNDQTEKQGQNLFEIPLQNENQISELKLQSNISFKQMYEFSLQEIQTLKQECQKLRQQLSIQCQKTNTTNSHEVSSFTGKNESRISFDFGDITAQLRDVQEMAEFSHERSRVTVDEQEITIRDERIENLQRQNVELQHELASKSHKLATIFNAAFEFGGMHLLDHLQNSIGLIESTHHQTQ